MIETVVVEVPNPGQPYGVKGVAEVKGSLAQWLDNTVGGRSTGERCPEARAGRVPGTAESRPPPIVVEALLRCPAPQRLGCWRRIPESFAARP